MKQVSIGDMFTAGEIKRCLHIWNEDRAHFHRRVLDEVVLGVMPRINKKLGQENDADYIAYTLEFALMTLDPMVPKP